LVRLRISRAVDRGDRRTVGERSASSLRPRTLAWVHAV